MTPETAQAMEAGLCLEDYRLRQKIVAGGDPWTPETYARERWGVGLAETTIVQREDMPPAFRPVYEPDSRLAWWRRVIEDNTPDAMRQIEDEYDLDMDDDSDPQKVAFLAEEARRRLVMGTIDPPDEDTA